MKSDCDKKIEEARSNAGNTSSLANAEDDEEKIGLMLKCGTLHLQMKGLKKENERLKASLATKQVNEDNLNFELQEMEMRRNKSAEAALKDKSQAASAQNDSDNYWQEA